MRSHLRLTGALLPYPFVPAFKKILRRLVVADHQDRVPGLQMEADALELQELS